MTGQVTALSPYICVADAASAIEFYKQAFGATEKFRLTDPADGRIGHAEIVIGGSVMMISDEYPDFGAVGPETLGGSPVKFHLGVDNADAAFARAIAAGATELRPLTDEFHGNRQAMVLDPFGHSWTVSSPIEDVSPVEMQQRWTKAMAG
ncbi:MAG: hypothetical protein RL367_2461 [Pseudomonadota bacterium]|jgi:PhnB protein